MLSTKLRLIDEQSSPLHRIMWVYNPEDVAKRSFENNISAFHVGNGYFMTVAHNLRVQAGYFKSISIEQYQKELLYKLDGSQKLYLEQYYFKDDYTGNMHLNKADADALKNIVSILKQKRFDTRWVTLAEKRLAIPHVLIQFRDQAFYKHKELVQYFMPNKVFHEPGAGRYTFMLEVELVHAAYDSDIAIYKLVGVPQEIIAKIPEVEPCYDFFEEDPGSLHCLQSSPNSEIGRLLNDAKIEGVLDHFNIMPDEVGGNVICSGYRYLVKGYFRFGSSGSPYLYYDAINGVYKVNAIQSEASGIQLSIKNERDGNFQYVNAIASPLYLVKDVLSKYLL